MKGGYGQSTSWREHCAEVTSSPFVFLFTVDKSKELNFEEGEAIPCHAMPSSLLQTPYYRNLGCNEEGKSSELNMRLKF